MLRRICGAYGGIPLVVLLAAVGILVVLQGWRSRIPNFDMLTTIDAAQELTSSRLLPDHGVLTSFMSFTPPGAAWFMAPGVLLFRDPRLFEYIGSIGLYVGTLFGIFLLTRRYLGRACAVLAVLLYAFSAIGLSAASTLWQRYPIHCFTVWTVLWIARWVDEDRPLFLAAALLTWAAGMYVFLEMAPLVLALPVVWWFRRPSVRVAPLLAVGALGVLLWYPYLRFEDTRRFVDVKSQVLREPIRHASVYQSWCDPALLPSTWLRGSFAELRPGASPRRSEAATARQWLADRIGLTGELLLANFRTVAAMPAAAGLLLLLTVCGVVALAGGNLSPTGRLSRGWRHRLVWLALAAAVLGVAFNEWTLARYLSSEGSLAASSIFVIRALQAGLLVGALIVATWRTAISTAVERVVSKWSASGPRTGTPAVALSVAVPWLLLFALADGERRLTWLWPLQVIPLAAAVTWVPLRLGASRWTLRIGCCAVALIVASNAVAVSRLDSWRHDGWSGRDAMEVEVTDRVAGLVRAEHHDHASIGYEVDIWRFMALANVADSRYKVGADFDLLLKYRYGIVNLDRCAEGVSPDDSYRVVQTSARAMNNPLGANRIPSTRGATFQPALHAGIYQIFRQTHPDGVDGGAAETP